MALSVATVTAAIALNPSKASVILHHKNHTRGVLSVTCGPRGNRGQLVRGRTLSTEAILAVQALKRAGGDDAKVDRIVSSSVVRLIKSDLLATLKELQRQEQWRIALKVFVAMRREHWRNVEYGLYAEMIIALGRNGMVTEIDTLVGDLLGENEDGGINGDDLRGLARLLKAIIACDRGNAVKAIYQAMKTGGCAGDEYLFKILSKGLRRLGECEAAAEVEHDQAIWFEQGGII